MIIAISTTTFAESKKSNEQMEKEIIDYMYQVNNSVGYHMTEEEIQTLSEDIKVSVKKYANENKVSLSTAYNMYLEEICREAPLSETSICSGGSDYGDTQLPSAQIGDIFFTDSDTPWNHVGIYASTYFIVESMPEDGVQYFSIYDINSYQDPVDNGDENGSCILRVSTTHGKKESAANWANNEDRLGRPYDIDFADNKSDYYRVNRGDARNPDYQLVSEGDAYNCSELVWKSYIKAANIDLDSNGGPGVYPNNIYDSNLTSIVQHWGNQ